MVSTCGSGKVGVGTAVTVDVGAGGVDVIATNQDDCQYNEMENTNFHAFINHLFSGFLINTHKYNPGYFIFKISE